MWGVNATRSELLEILGQLGIVPPENADENTLSEMLLEAGLDEETILAEVGEQRARR